MHQRRIVIPDTNNYIHVFSKVSPHTIHTFLIHFIDIQRLLLPRYAHMQARLNDLPACTKRILRYPFLKLISQPFQPPPAPDYVSPFAKKIMKDEPVATIRMTTKTSTCIMGPKIIIIYMKLHPGLSPLAPGP